MPFPSLFDDYFLSLVKDAEKRGKQKAKEAAAIRMLKGGELAMEEIVNYTDLPLAAVQNLAKAVALGTV